MRDCLQVKQVMILTLLVLLVPCDLFSEEVQVNGWVLSTRLEGNTVYAILKKDVDVFNLVKFSIEAGPSLEFVSSTSITPDQLRKLSSTWRQDLPSAIESKLRKAIEDGLKNERQKLESDIALEMGFQEHLSLHIISWRNFGSRTFVVYQYGGSDLIYGGNLVILNEELAVSDNVPLVDSQFQSISSAVIVGEHTALVFKRGAYLTPISWVFF